MRKREDEELSQRAQREDAESAEKKRDLNAESQRRREIAEKGRARSPCFAS